MKFKRNVLPYALGAFLILGLAGVMYARIDTIQTPRIMIGVSSPDGVDERSIGQFVSQYMKSSGVPGAAIVITKGQNIVFSSGFGVDSRGVPITSATRMPIASLAKSFTALAVMQLVEAGEIDLDAPVAVYLPEFKMGDGRYKGITVRHLLNQTSGMSDTVFPEKSLPQPDSLQNAVARLKDAPLLRDPGAAWHYHNPNYQIAARLVEAVSGEPFSSYLKTHIFDPLSMSATLAVDNFSYAQLPEGHIHAYGGVVPLPEPKWYAGGAGGVITTADDLGKWLILHAVGSSTPIISSESIAAMHTATSSVKAYALGWIPGMSNGVETFSHNGWMFTYTADQIIVPEGEWGVGVMTNGGLSLLPTDSDAISRGILAILMTGQAPQIGGTGPILDFVFGLLTILALVLGVRGMMNAERWARKWSSREGWQQVLAVLLVLVPLILLSMYPIIMGALFGGRDATWEQILYVAVSPTIFLIAASLAGLIVALLRIWNLLRKRARGASSPSTSATLDY